MAGKFLEQIADYYTAPERVDSLADTYFIMPNKRSGIFLKHYIQQRAVEKPIFMPRFATMQRLASSLLRIPMAERVELLFMLYKAYCEESERVAHQEVGTEFDRFIFWGDMILGDYDTIDKSMADADRVYSNISDFHDIRADYLTAEQKEIINRIWGETFMTGETERFWFPSTKDQAKSEIERKFVSLWEVLGPMYHNLRARLEQAGLSTPGLLIRRAAEMLKHRIPGFFGRYRYVFVGLSDLSTAELSIMESLSRKGHADFFWDTDMPMFSRDEKGGEGGAAALVARLARKYPSPDDFRYEAAAGDALIEVFGVPSNLGMAKGAAEELRKSIGADGLTKAEAINTAFILPDAGMLMPLLSGLPKIPTGYNVTMALPYPETSFATLLRDIIMLQSNVRRNRDGRVLFLYDNVIEILSHPHISALVPEKIDVLRQRIIDARKVMIEGDELAAALPELDYIFVAIKNPDNLEDTYHYLKNLLTRLGGGLAMVSAAYPAASKKELQTLELLQAEIDRIRILIERYGVNMKESTFLRLFERILNSQPINLEGTPLGGVQVMGVLETRCLDFDNITYLSMNEKVFPKRDYVRTMLPNALRYYFGMPTIQHSESFYSYYFFRSLSRAKRVTLFYDSRTPGATTGEISRFLTRLMYLKGNATIKHYGYDATNLEPKSEPIVIEKSDEVRARLGQYLAGGSRALSASSLKNLFHCPLRFYLENVNSINVEDEPQDYLSAATLGSIFHDTLQFLLRPYEGKLITADVLRELKKQDKLDSAFYESLANNTEYESHRSDDDLKYEFIMVRGAVQHQVRCLLDAEIERLGEKGDFVYVKGESEHRIEWEVIPGELKVNFLMRIDRLDRMSASHLRIVDYKTGKNDSTVIGNEIGNVFKASNRAGLLQLMIYAEAYHDAIDRDSRITISLINIGKVVETGKITDVTFNKRTLPDCPDFPPEFREEFNARMAEFFLSDAPILQTADTDNCMYCQFQTLCNRNLPTDQPIRSSGKTI